MMQLCEPLFGTGSIVIHDAGFACVPALIQLKRKGVFASCLLKKKKYWPKFSHGAANAEHMAGKPIGSIDAMQGKFGGEDFAIYLMQDSKYTLQLASTYGKNERKGPDKRRRCEDTNQLYSFKCDGRMVRTRFRRNRRRAVWRKLTPSETHTKQ